MKTALIIVSIILVLIIAFIIWFIRSFNNGSWFKGF